MQYLYLVGATLCSSTYNLTQGIYGKKDIKKNPICFTAIVGFTVMLFFLIINGLKFSFDLTTLYFALGFGISYFCCTFSSVLAQKYGSASITFLVLSYSLLLPTFYGLLFLDEKIDVYFIIGLILTATSIFLMNFRLEKKENKGNEEVEEGKKQNKVLWIIFLVLAFFANGACSIIQSAQQRALNGNFKSELMIMAMGVVVILSAIVFLTQKQEEKLQVCKQAFPFGVISGTLNAVVNLTVMLLVSAQKINISIIFPIISAGGLLLSYIFARTVFKEKLTLLKNIGFMIGLVSIVFFNL